MEKLTQRLTRHEIETITDIDKLKQVLRIYSKAANTRLRALEKANLTTASPAYEEVRNYAYDDRNFMAWTRKGEFKFNTNTRGMEVAQIRAELKALDTFLFRTHTSTVTGAKTARQKIREATTKQNSQGTKSQKVIDFFEDMTDEEFDDFWKYENIKRLYDMYGSDEAVRIIEAGLENPYINGSYELLDMALVDILNDTAKSLSSIYREIEDYTPTGSVV